MLPLGPRLGLGLCLLEELVVEMSMLTMAAAAAAVGVRGVGWAWVGLEAVVVAVELVVEVARGAVVVVIGPSIAVVEPVLVNQMVCVKPDCGSGASASV